MYAISTWLTPLFYQGSLNEVNTVLSTLKDFGVIGLLILVIGLGVIGFILDRRNEARAQSDNAKADQSKDAIFTQILNTQTDLLKKAQVQNEQDKAAAREDSQKRLENDVIIHDILNRGQDTQDKIAATLVELKNQSKYINDEAMKSNMLLASLNAEIKKVVADTPLMPHIEEMKKELEQIKTLVNAAATSREMQGVYECLTRLTDLLDLDMKAETDKKEAARRVSEAAERIANQMGAVPLVEDLPEREDNDEEAQP